MVSYVTEPRESKGDVDPPNLKVSFMPNWMNQFQIPENEITHGDDKTRIFTIL